MAHLPLQIKSDSWQVFYYTIPENMRAVVNFDLLACGDDYRTHYLHSCSIKIQLNHFNELGLPTPEENQLANATIDRLIDYLTENEIDCKEVGILTYYGMKEVFFQIPKDNIDRFKKAFDEWSKQQSIFKIELAERENGWDFFDLKIKPTPEDREQIKNRTLITKIQQIDSNSERRYVLEHLFIGQKENLEQLSQELSNIGFKPEKAFNQLNENEDKYSLLAMIETELDLDYVTDMTSFLLKLCKEKSCDYDGWGTSTVA